MIQNPIFFWPRKKKLSFRTKRFSQECFYFWEKHLRKILYFLLSKSKIISCLKKKFQVHFKKSVFSPEINCVLCFFFSCVYDSRTGEIFFFFSESLYLFFFFFKSVGSFTCFHKCIITIIRKCNCIVLFIISFSNLNLNCGVNYKFRDGWCWINGKTLLMNGIQKKSFHYNNMNGQVALLIKK